MRTLMLLLVLGGAASAQAPTQPQLGSRTAPVIEHAGQRFKDLNRNGRLDPYEDWRRGVAERARDLVRRLTLEEMAGLMMHGTARTDGPMGAVGFGTGYDLDANRALITDSHVNSLITRLAGKPRDLAEEHNKLQEIAEASRLGVPLTISTDPRHHFQYVPGASVQSGRFSQWPETLGFAAIGDTTLMRRFGDVARQEYRAVGIHMTLSPQADVATEPRWGRISGTFGEDAALAGAMARAYVEGFQHSATGVVSDGVAAVVKHWVGYGAAKDGFDSHSYYGRYADFPTDNLDYHVRPFLGAFAVNVAGVMPTYSILEGVKRRGKAIEPVAVGYNAELLTNLLRTEHKFRGLVVSDWGITSDCAEICRSGAPAGTRPSFAHLGMPWGVEDLSMEDRFRKAVEAGIDQFGGTERTDLLVKLVRDKRALRETRLGESAYRSVLLKFQLGLFENPYVDPARADALVGGEEFRGEATRAQRRSLVLLENKNAILPIDATGRRVFLHGVDSSAAKAFGFVIATDPAQADVAIVRTNTPHETLHPGFIFGTMLHEGNLGFRDGDPEFEAIKRISAAVPTVLTVYLDRPAILTGVKDRVAALVANFGVSDAALLEVLTGRAKPEGKLPFELPSSMEAVQAQRPNVPFDSRQPLYPFGFGRTF
jgi:beta-glucosidase